MCAIGMLGVIVGEQVMFIQDISDNFFEYILERDQPAHTAVLVDDQREVATRRLKCIQEAR